MLLGILFKSNKIVIRQIDKLKSLLNKGSKQADNSPFIPAEKPPQKAIQSIEKLARNYEGKFLLREEISLSLSEFNLLKQLHYFIPIKAIMKKGFTYCCTRCHNKDLHLFAELPCSRCDTVHVYCRNCIHMGRVLACENLYYWNGPKYPWEKHRHPITWLGELTSAQQQAAHKMIQTICKKNELLIWAVTGAGKTEMLYPGINKALEEGLRVCIASPRADVIRELLPRLKSAFQSIHIQGLYSGSRDKDGTAQLILATTHQLLRYRQAFDVLIIDEIDAFPYHKDPALQFAANRAKKESAATIYLTATPREKHRIRIAAKKLEHIFVPVRFHGNPLIVPEWKYIHNLHKQLKNNELPEVFKKWITGRQKPTRQLLIFVPTIELADRLVKASAEFLLKNQLISKSNQITAVHAEDEDRAIKILQFRNKALFAMITTTILERGVTFPSIDVAVLHANHQVFDEAALIQITGRAGRSPLDPKGDVGFFHEGKTDAMVRANKEIKLMNQRRLKQIGMEKIQ